ncbi:MAG: hypothetical protein ISS28_08165 [Candidatus Cloacimonetes bacterium]|nr:hypothetical protein [Candidatus Cloacimonadota bacterium]
MIEKKEASEFIKETRERLDLTRKNLALILDVSEPTVIRWEGAQKGKDATAIDKHNLNLIETLKWLYKEVQKEKTGVHLKYIFSIILGSSESKKALENMQKKGFGWVAIGLTASLSFAAIPFSLMGFIPFVGGLSMTKLALDKKKNEDLFKKLNAFTQKYGAKGLLYIVGQIREGIEIKNSGVKL